MSRNNGSGGLPSLDSEVLTGYVRADENTVVLPVKDVKAAVQSIASLLDDREPCRMVEQGYTTVTDCADSDATNDFLNIVEQRHSAKIVLGS